MSLCCGYNQFYCVLLVFSIVPGLFPVRQVFRAYGLYPLALQRVCCGYNQFYCVLLVLTGPLLCPVCFQFVRFFVLMDSWQSGAWDVRIC